MACQLRGLGVLATFPTPRALHSGCCCGVVEGMQHEFMLLSTLLTGSAHVEYLWGTLFGKLRLELFHRGPRGSLA